MKFITFIQLCLRNLRWLVLFPLAVAVFVFFFTKNTPKTYSTNMVIYTGITTGYNYENEQNGRVDYFAVNARFDNLIITLTSKETRKEVSLRLLAHLLHYPDTLKEVIQLYQAEALASFANNATIKQMKGQTEDETYQRINQAMKQNSDDPFYRIVFGQKESPFHVNVLSTIVAKRMNASDLIQVDYSTLHPYLCKKTLDVLAQVFLSKYKTMRVGEADKVMTYFEEQTDIARRILQQKEEKLKQFRTENQLINYYEQTKYIADQKEEIENRETALNMDLAGYKSSLKKIESKLANRNGLQAKNEQLVASRNNLSVKLNALYLKEIKGATITAREKEEIEEQKEALKNEVQGVYEANNTVEGITSKTLLEEWINITIHQEEAASKLNVLEKNKAEFLKIYAHYAPLGSELTKIEREVDVAEKEYLNLLDNLNESKLKQRNMRVSESINVVEPAQLPVVPNSSKRMVLIILGFMGSAVAVLITLIMKEYMDDSVREPARLHKLAGIPVITSFAGKIKSGEAEADKLAQLCNNKWLDFLNETGNQSENGSVVLQVPINEWQQESETLRTLEQRIKAQHGKWTFENIQQHTVGEDSEALHYVQLTSPNPEILPGKILAAAKYVVLTINAGKPLNEFQLRLIEQWKNTGIPVKAVLFNARIHYMEDSIGEIPKKRSQLRIFLKSLIKKTA